MRGFLLVPVVAAAVVAGAASASADARVAARTPGAEGFELHDGNGRAVVVRRGAVLVALRRGRIRVVDLPGGRRPRWNCNQRGRRVSRTTVQFRGRDVRCRVWSGNEARPWQVVIRGRGIFASGRARGSLTLDAAERGSPGAFRIGTAEFEDWPRQVETFVLRS